MIQVPTAVWVRTGRRCNASGPSHHSGVVQLVERLALNQEAWRFEPSLRIQSTTE